MKDTSQYQNKMTANKGLIVCTAEAPCTSALAHPGAQNVQARRNRSGDLVKVCPYCQIEILVDLDED